MTIAAMASATKDVRETLIMRSYPFENGFPRAVQFTRVARLIFGVPGFLDSYIVP